MPEQDQQDQQQPQEQIPSMDDYVASREAEEAKETPAAPVEAQESSESGTETPADPAAAPKPPDEQSRRAKGVQKRIDELTRRAAEAERRADMLLEMERARVESATRSQPTPQPADADQAPREEDFQDYREFLRAEARYYARQETQGALQQERAAREAEQAQRTRESEQQRAVQQFSGQVAEFQSRNAEFAKAAPDYDATVSALDNIEVGPHNAQMIQTLLHRPDSARLLYYMGKNPQVAEHISNLPPALQGSAIGEFAAAIRATAQPSKAPPPGRPVGSRAPSGGDLTAASSMDDYDRLRSKQTRR